MITFIFKTDYIMYCKKCGTEQKDGQKFCPKCGTPYVVMEQDKSKSSKEGNLTETNNPQEIDTDIEQMQNFQNKNIENTTHDLSSNEDKKVRRIAKAGMWIILIAIVLTFVNAGFGFSFWWYLYLIIMTVIAMALWITAKTDPNIKLNDGDALLTKIISWIGAIMLAILYLWGPLNGDYEGSRENSESYRHEQYEQSTSSDDSNRAPSWIQGTWYCVTPYGNMQVEIVGDHIREIPGDGSSYYGTYHIQGDAIMPETGSQMYYQMDFDKKRLSAGHGYYFRKQ